MGRFLSQTATRHRRQSHTDASEIPAIAQPWFLAFNASVEIHLVMVPDDLAKAGGSIENTVKKYA
jgi:hypothetical protein